MRACGEPGLPLVVIGEGRDAEALGSLAGDSVRFLGRLSGDQVRHVMARCRTFILPGEEDFGIAPVDAQAAGRPAVSYAAGGALDTVIDRETGVLFREPSMAGLRAALQRLDGMRFSPEWLTRHAAHFDRSHFQAKLRRAVESAVASGDAPPQDVA